jgi:hypothetical protein
MVLESYRGQQNLAMSATFTGSALAGTESIETELKDAGNGQDMADVTLVPRDIRH